MYRDSSRDRLESEGYLAVKYLSDRGDPTPESTVGNLDNLLKSSWEVRELLGLWD